MVNSPKDYLTDRVKEFDKLFRRLNIDENMWPIKAFLTQTITQSMEVGENKILDLYSQVMLFAHKNNQVVGEKRNYYITLEQLEAFIKSLSPKL